MQKSKQNSEVKVAGLLSTLPLPNRAPTPEEVDMMLTMWGTDLKQDPAEKHRLEISIVELTEALGPKLSENIVKLLQGRK
jgi:hypothetical protein